MPDVKLKWGEAQPTSVGTDLAPQDQLLVDDGPPPDVTEDFAPKYLLARQVTHEFHDPKVQNYVNAVSAMEQARQQAAMTEMDEFRKEQQKKKAKGTEAESAFAESMVQGLNARIKDRGVGGEPVPGSTGGDIGKRQELDQGMVEKEVQAETGGAPAPMVDFTQDFGAGFGARLMLNTGMKLIPSLGRAAAAGLVNMATGVPIGVAADVVETKVPELSLPTAVVLGLFSGATIEPIIERGIVNAAKAAGQALDPATLRAQVPVIRNILANETGAVGRDISQPAPVWRSQMEDVLTAKLPGRGDPKQFLETLDKMASPPDEVVERLGELTNKLDAFKKGKGGALTPAELSELSTLKQAVAPYKSEFKREELEWSGVREWLQSKSGKVTKDEVLEYLRENNVRVEEVMKGQPLSPERNAEYLRRRNEIERLRDYGGQISAHEAERRLAALDEEFGPTDNIGATRDRQVPTVYQQYQLPGGENYRELLLTLPQQKRPVSFEQWLSDKRKTGEISYTSTQDAERFRPIYEAAKAKGTLRQVNDIEKGFASSHYQEPNILAHVRFNERVDADGKRVLFIEEVQSDWAQKGRKGGFNNRKDRIPDGWKIQKQEDGFWGVFDEGGTLVTENRTQERAIAEAIDWNNRESVPDAPFVKDTGKWSMLAMKRMVRYAAENGFDRIAWTTGEQQAARYDLSKKVESIIYDRNKGIVRAFPIDRPGEVIEHKGVTPEKLSDVVGKEAAEKLLGKDFVLEPGVSELVGDDLKVGGEGMKGFYDLILPAEMNRFFGKAQWGGARVGSTSIDTTFRLADGTSGIGVSKKDPRPGAGVIVHSLDITPQMKAKAVSEGMPLFGVAGSAAGFDQDEEGNITFDPKKAVAGAAAGIAGMKFAPQVMKYVKKELNGEIANTPVSSVTGVQRKLVEDADTAEVMQKVQIAATRPPEPPPQPDQKFVEAVAKQNPQQTAQLMAMAPGSAAGFEREEGSGQITFSPEKAAIGIAAGAALAMGGAKFGIEKRGTQGKYLRGGKVKAVKTLDDVVPIVSKKLDAKSIQPAWDQVQSVEEAAAWAKEMTYIEPEVVGDKVNLRWRKNDEGYYGNGKMAFGNDAYPQGRNTWDIAGCGREGWASENGIDVKQACYGGACYAEVQAKSKGQGSAASGERFTVVSADDAKRAEIESYFKKHGADATRKKYPTYEIRHYPEGSLAPETGYSSTSGLVYKRPSQEKYSLKLRTDSAGRAAKVSTNLQPADGQDIRLGVDTDGAAWLSKPEVMDAIVGANPRSLTVYSAGYHTPPPPHPLSERTIINVTVSGWHPLPETLSRIRWAQEARANGWNVILREVTADPGTFANDTVAHYNRLHEALVKSDFFVMEQPLHIGATSGAPAKGLPGCCKGSKTNPHTCDNCEVAEGLGKGFQRYWNIYEEGGSERIIPGVADYKGNKRPSPFRVLRNERGETTISGGDEPTIEVRPLTTAAGAAVGGIDQDEEGNVTFNPERALMGAAAGYGIGAAIGGRGGISRKGGAGARMLGESGQLTVRGGGGPPQSVSGSTSGIPSPPDDMASAGQQVLSGMKTANTLTDYAGPGNLRLWGANLDLKYPEDVMKALVAGAEVFDPQVQIARRGTRTIAEGEAAASGMKLEDFLGRRLGQALNQEQTINAQDNFVAILDNFKQAAKVITAGGATDIDKANFMSSMNLFYAGMMQMSGAAAEAGRALQTYKRMKTLMGGKMADLQEFMAGASRLPPEKLAAIMAEAESPAELAGMVRLAATATSWQMFKEGLVNVLIGPYSQIANFAGNMVSGLWMVGEHGLASVVSNIPGVGSKEIKLGEGVQAAYGFVEGWKDALKLMGRALKTGTSQFEGQTGKTDMGVMKPAITAENIRSKLVGEEGQRNWLQDLVHRKAPNVMEEGTAFGFAADALGEIVRSGFGGGGTRMLSAMDDFFKVLTYRSQLRARAYRMATEEITTLDGATKYLAGIGVDTTGMTDQKKVATAIGNRIAEVLSDPAKHAPDLNMAAVKAADYATFTNDLDQAGQAALGLLQKAPALQLIVPFFKTPYNVNMWAMRRFLPTELMMPSTYKTWGNKASAERDLLIARTAMGSALGIVTGLLAWNGYITGGGPTAKDKKLRPSMYNTNWKPYSITLDGETYYPYKYGFEPMSTMVGWTADSVDILKSTRSEDPEVQNSIEGMAAAVSLGWAKNALNTTFLSGLSRFISAVDDPDRYGKKYLEGFGGMFVPGVSRDIEKLYSPERKDIQSVMDMVKSKVPGWSESLPRMRNRWGEVIKVDNRFLPNETKMSAIDNELIALRADLSKPRRDQYFEMNGQRISRPIELTAEQYEDFIVTMNKVPLNSTGETVKQTLSDVIKDSSYKDMTPEQKIHKLHRYWIEAQQLAKREMMNKWQDITQRVERDIAAQMAARR